ncbi:PP2C family serine/threonine-protein phosphatase [Caulobacter mirabilis]|uniref:Protein phosphatase 2C domain-containing protein n=1 Tax=Caulobacter mirabilis TaxID=69666 RepID=A0A2D2AVT1_9CAUL|nr:PP2C family serine/threonine-protein phosphatase [Caulobacter mirabilis]ATQ42081.1 hypothetical protein CSW64_06445 [Caulobacter mirabilis]
MRLDLMQSVSLNGDLKRPNDDRAGTNGRSAWVIDGATDLGAPGLLGRQGGAAWIASAADAGFAAAEAGDLRETCGQMFEAVAQRFRAARRREITGRWELPTAAFAAVQPVDGQVEIAWAADCAVLHRSGDGVRWLSPTPDRASESSAAASFGPLPDSGALSSQAILEDRRAHRSRALRSVLSPDPETSAIATAYARTPVRAGDMLLLMTDGFTALADAYAAYDAAGLFEAVVTKGLPVLGEELRAIEQADSTCARYPRFKISDDATALWVRIAD